MALEHGLEFGHGMLLFSFANPHPLIDRPRHDGLGIGAASGPAVRVTGATFPEAAVLRRPTVTDLVRIRRTLFATGERRRCFGLGFR
jgi:hypothetical protein